MIHLPRKPIKWMGSAKKDLDKMPEDVKDVFGHAIDLAQAGQKYADAKPLQGFKSAGVLEVVESDEGGTYRAVYTVRLAGWIYVLHCFQKKSTKGSETPKIEMDLIRSRLSDAEADHDAWVQQTKGVKK